MKELSLIPIIISDVLCELVTKITSHIKKIKQEYQNNMVKEKAQLILNICTDYKLNFDELKVKYLKQSELNNLLIETTLQIPDDVNECLLTKIIVDNIEYYYEQRDNGNVYDGLFITVL